MGKFCGNVGYSIEKEISPGEWVTVIEEKKYYGDILSRKYSSQNGLGVNDNVNMNIRISVIGDPFAKHNSEGIRYIVYNNARWKINSIDDTNPPRIIYELGGIYNGPIPEEITIS